MNLAVIFATLIVTTPAGQSTVWDKLSDKACAEAAMVANRGLTVTEAAEQDARIAQAQQERQAEWERRNPKTAAECARMNREGVWGGACWYNGEPSISVSSGYYPQPVDLTVKRARCVP